MDRLTASVLPRTLPALVIATMSLACDGRLRWLFCRMPWCSWPETDARRRDGLSCGTHVRRCHFSHAVFLILQFAQVKAVHRDHVPMQGERWLGMRMLGENVNVGSRGTEQ